jgi:hypothetical protein
MLGRLRRRLKLGYGDLLIHLEYGAFDVDPRLV